MIDPVAHVVLDSLSTGGTLRRLAFDPVTSRAVIADEDGGVIFAH